MQVVEKLSEGLSRSYGVMVPASELGAALEARITEILPTLRLKGFRPGKVPPAHVKRLYGKGLMSEVIEKTINETSQQVLADHQLRVAAPPDLKPVSDMEKVLSGGVDLAYDIEVELMPDFEPMDVSTLSLTRPVYRAEQSEVEEALAEIVASNRIYEARVGKSLKAHDGDQLLIDFVGKIDGVAFDGGSAEDAEIVLGAGRFIPGFEEQLVGVAGGKDATVNVTFPADYGAESLAGKAAVFDVKVKEVRAPKGSKADDALAERLGFTDLVALNEAIRKNIEREYEQASRFKLKRALLDALDGKHDIPLPPRMVEAEFAAIWAQVEKDKAEGEESPEDAGKSEEDLRGEYRKISERRVRLGLVLAEIGRRDNVQVTEAELGAAMRDEAMKYGAQAQQIFDLMRQNANLQNQMRAPLYEEKVVDLIIGRAKVEDKLVSKEELLREDDLPEGYGGEEEPAKAKAAPKKAKAQSTGGDAEAPATAGKSAKAKPVAKAKAETANEAAAAQPAIAKAPAKPKAAKAKE